MTTLITFVGRTEANRAYKLARYRFDDGVEVESKLFAAAALSWMRRGKQPPNRMLIVGTPTSGWDVLMELVERLAPLHADEALEWAVPVSDALANGAVAPDSLRDFEQRFSKALGVRLDLVIAQNDGDSVFATLDKALASNEHVVLDITHSYRSMPVHALVALGAMRWLKGVQLRDIIYGSLDEKDPMGVSAARSLGSTSALARATPALAQLALVDDVGSIAGFFEASDRQTADRLRQTQQLESLLQFSAAAAPRGQAIGALRKVVPRGAIESSVNACTRSTLEALNAGNGSRGLRNRTERALARGDFMRATGLANEMLLLRAVEVRSIVGDYKQLNDLARDEVYRQCDLVNAPRAQINTARNDYTTLNYARNAVMHADGGIADQETPRVLRSEPEMRALLAWALCFYDFMS